VSMRYTVAVQSGRICLGIAGLVVMLLVGVPGDAGAVPISGTFSGTATGSWLRLPNGEFSDFDGETVTGTFRIDPALIPDDPPGDIVDGQRATFAHSGASYVSLSFTVRGEDVTFVNGGEAGDLLYLVSTSEGQSVGFGINSLYPYHNAGFSIAGPAGSLFDPFLPQTLRVDADTVLTSVSFFFSRDFGLNGLSNLHAQIDEVAVAVPEPGALGLLGLGVAGLAGLGARSRRIRGPADGAGVHGGLFVASGPGTRAAG
jgi:hypothetical protein